MDKLPFEHQNNQEIIRISVNNLVSDINGKIIGIVNKKGLRFGKKNVSLIGGGAELFDKNYIENLGGFDFEGSDARFKIPANKLEEITNLFSKYNPTLYEMDVARELKEELCEEIIGDMVEPIINIEELKTLSTEYRGVIYYEGHGNSQKRDIITKYIMHLFSLNGPTEVLEKIFSNSVAHIIEQEDILCGITKDGYRLGDNIIGAYNFLLKLNK